MNKMIKMLGLVVVGAVASLAQGQGTVSSGSSGIANNSELAQVLVKPPAYKITYANTKTVVTNDWMVFVWVARGEKFEGLNADGTAVNTNTSIVLEKFPIKDGTFRPFTAAWPKSRWSNSKGEVRPGDIRLLLLDTRLFEADAEYRATNGTSLVENQAMTIQAYGTAGYYSSNGAGADATVTNEAGQATAPWADIPNYQPTEIPEDTPVPVQTDIDKGTTNTTARSGSGRNQKSYTIYHPYVTITATNTVATLVYAIERSTDANFAKDTTIISSSKKKGLSDPNAVLTFVVDAPKYYTYKSSMGWSTYGPYVYDETKSGNNRYTTTSYDSSTAYYYRVVRYVETTAEDGTTSYEVDEDGYSNIKQASLTDESSSSDSSSDWSKIFGF
jgi:hypothetical protein